MTRYALNLIAVVLLLAGCTQSKLARDAKVTISGDVAAAESNTVVAMRIEPTGWQAAGGLGLAFSTLGMSCALHVGEVCRDGTTRVGTAGDGAFQFHMTGEDLQDAFGTAQTVSFTVGGPPRDREISGPVTTLTTKVQVADLQLGSLDMWRPDIKVGSQPPATADIRWNELPTSIASAPKAYQVVFDDAHGGIVWRQRGAGAAGFDARLLEGTTGGVSVMATADIPVPDAVAETTFRSPRLPYISGFSPPPSRGATCDTGQPDKTAPCPLTDGDFATPVVSSQPTVIDLGRVLDVSLLAVRGCGEGCVVEVSTDRTTWSPYGRVTDAFGVVSPDSPTPAAFIRVTPDASSLLTEVSVWDGARPHSVRASALELAEPGVVAPQRPEVLEVDSLVWAWIVAGSAATLLIAGTAGFLLGRRRRG